MIGLQYIAYALLAGLLVGYVKGCSDESDRGEQFKIAVAAVGEAQEARTRERIAKEKHSKEKADEETKPKRAAHVAAAGRLSIDVASSSVVPPAGPAAASPDRITFDRAELNGAFREFIQETAGISIEGAAAVIDLDIAKRWAQDR